MMGRFI